MLASPEEAYTAYLERAVTDAGVDPVVVRATLKQLGYNDAIIAVIMGEAGAVDAFSSSSTSSTLTDATSKTLSSALSHVKQQRGAVSDSASSAPSKVARPLAYDPDQAQEVATTSPPFMPPPSIMREGKSPSCTPTSASSSSTPGPAELEQEGDASAVSTIGLEDKSPDEAEMADRSCGPKAVLATSSSPSIPSQYADQWEEDDYDSHPVMRYSWGADAPFNPSSLLTALTSGEQEVVLRWMSEYKALLLSSAIPRRAYKPHSDSPERKLPLAEPCDECHSVLHTNPSSVGSAYEGGGDEGLPGQSGDGECAPCRSHHADCHRHEKNLIDDSILAATSSTSTGGFSGDVDTSSASSSSVDARAAKRSADAFTSHADFPVVHRESNKGCWRRHASLHAAAAPLDVFRNVVPKAKSALFVPTCGLHSPYRGAACMRCTFTEADCRHPYREAQDVRIVRASQSLAGAAGRVKPGGGVSQSRARQLDAARQAQHTSRAEPAIGCRIPIMQAPARPSVHLRSGLSNGRQATTLPQSARTDRVSLARYYRHEWEKQARRTTVASRDAVWDTRYALLSCNNASHSA